MDSISSHGTGMIAILDYAEYIHGEETVARDSVGWSRKYFGKEEMNCIDATKGPSKKKQASPLLFLIT